MRNKKRKIALLLLILLLASPLINFSIRQVSSSVWDGSHHINIAIDNGDIHVWSIEPSERNAVLVIIPQNLYLHTASYGEYKASSIGRLSLIEKGDGSLVVDAISQTLAVPIDAVLVRKEGTTSVFDGRDAFGVAGLFRTVSTNKLLGRVSNLTLYDFIRLWIFANTLKKGTIAVIDVSASLAAESFELPDKTQGLTIDKERFGKTAAKYFLDKAVASENLTIELLNGTNTAGLANDFAMLVANLGGKVISTGKSQADREETVVFTKSKNYTAEKLAKLLGGKLIFSIPKDSRADIQVVLGGRK